LSRNETYLHNELYPYKTKNGFVKRHIPCNKNIKIFEK